MTYAVALASSVLDPLGYFIAPPRGRSVLCAVQPLHRPDRHLGDGRPDRSKKERGGGDRDGQ